MKKGVKTQLLYILGAVLSFVGIYYLVVMLNATTENFAKPPSKHIPAHSSNQQRFDANKKRVDEMQKAIQQRNEANKKRIDELHKAHQQKKKTADDVADARNLTYRPPSMRT